MLSSDGAGENGLNVACPLRICHCFRITVGRLPPWGSVTRLGGI